MAGADVLIRNTQPPFDSTGVRTGATGDFSLKLKPGVYLAQASGGDAKSPGWERLLVPDEPPFPKLRLVLTGLGSIHGVLKDARTEAPVENARIALTTHGNRAAVTRTGPTGNSALSRPPARMRCISKWRQATALPNQRISA